MARRWLISTVATGGVVLLGWGLMKVLVPSREEMLKVRNGRHSRSTFQIMTCSSLENTGRSAAATGDRTEKH